MIRYEIKKSDWHTLILAIVLILIIYIPFLNNPLIDDDTALIQNLPSGNISTVFSNPPTIIRPLIYILLYKVFGLNTVVFRLTNILLHIGVTCLLYILLRLISKQFVATISTLIFAVHPILTESVTWISGGVYAQYSFFSLLSLVTYFLFKKNKKLYVISIIAFIIALLSSDKAIAVVLLFILFELSFGNIRLQWKKLVPYIIMGGGFVLFYILQIKTRFQDIEYIQESLSYSLKNAATPVNPVHKIIVAVTSYLNLIIWPQKLTLYHTELSFTVCESYCKIFEFALFLAIIIYGYYRKRQLFFWLSFFAISLTPVLAPFRIAPVVAERYIYLGSIGVIVSITTVMYPLYAYLKIRYPSVVLFTLLITALALRSYTRNSDWKNEFTFWKSTVKNSPSLSVGHMKLGMQYGYREDWNEAVSEFQQAIILNPNYIDAYYNLAIIYKKNQQDQKALDNFKKAVEINPQLWKPYEQIAVIYTNNQKYDLAYNYAQKALSINPNSVDIWFDLAVIYLGLQDEKNMRKAINKALEIDPNHKQTQQFLNKYKDKDI